MKRFPPEHRPERFRPGETAYLRARIVEGVKLPFGLEPPNAIAVRLIDRRGRPIGDTLYYVPEIGLISKADALAAVAEALR
jgi:hypothetical protein